MGSQEQLVAVISPWNKLPELVRANFRVETLPTEKKVMVWRDDLRTADALTGELTRLGVGASEVRQETVTTAWQTVK